MPTAVFSEPALGVIGLTEHQARERLARLDVYKTTFRPMKATLSGRDTRSFMKLLVDGDTDRVVGCHIVGPDAAERLAKEESFYRDLHPGYRNHFDRLGEPEGTVGVAAPNATAAEDSLAAYAAYDTIVVRGLASAKVDAMTAVAAAAAPR